jgi:Mn2+/Fe2+ NRAMP family transporter
VVLSFVLPLPMIARVVLSARKSIMGEFALGKMAVRVRLPRRF